MPIRPENRHRYGPNWRAIRQAILERAENRCECTGQCGSEHACGRCNAPHGEAIMRMDGAEWVALGSGLADDWGRVVRVVLTCAHLDHTPEHNDSANLLAMCQRCHLRYDRDHHLQTARQTRRRKHSEVQHEIDWEGET